MDEINTTERKVFPRWRSIDRTHQKELRSTKAADPALNKILEATAKAAYYKWRETPSLENAVEAIDSFIFLDDHHLAVGPANTVLNQEHSMPSSKAIASSLLRHGDGHAHENYQDFNHPEKIRAIKKSLKEHPRNSLLWLEKGRLHTIQGELTSAHRALKVAAACAPNNRFIVRGVARFLVHTHKLDEAHHFLAQCEALPSDPWIQATEIAIAEAASIRPRSIKTGLRILQEGDIDPAHKAELAAALGTVELISGATRRAKRLFNQCLILPNDNALAQALWARDEAGLGVNIGREKLNIIDAHEARTIEAISRQSWAEAVNHCRRWLEDEPFSLRPAIEGSYLASSFLQHHDDALEFCRAGLDANPNDRTLQNNAAVMLAKLGRIDEAKAAISTLLPTNYLGSTDATALATRGLIAFRDRDVELGRNLYQTAMNVAEESGKSELKFRAYIHWLYEEARVGLLPKDEVEKLTMHLDQYVERSSLNKLTQLHWGLLKDRLNRCEPADLPGYNHAPPSKLLYSPTILLP